MTRTPPPSDWVAYLTVFLVVVATMYGKFLIGRGDKDDIISTNEKKEDINDKS
jgi:hypothetical protein